MQIQSGTFCALHREWKDGDVVEYSIARNLRLEAVDAQNPNTVALLLVRSHCSPLMRLAAVSPDRSRVTRSQLLEASQPAKTARLWQVHSAAAPVSFPAFPDIRDEQYRLYHEV